MNKHYAYWYAVVTIIALLAAFGPIVVSGRAVTPTTIIAVLIVVLLVPLAILWAMERMGYPVRRPITCPNCGTEMPLFRQPRSIRQGIQGGYTCPRCGTEIDAKGRMLR